jgi:hypothetical protein
MAWVWALVSLLAVACAPAPSALQPLSPPVVVPPPAPAWFVSARAHAGSTSTLALEVALSVAAPDNALAPRCSSTHALPVCSGPDRAQPARRVMLVGSSTMGGAIGVPLARALEALDVDVSNLGQASTSLARGDIMHWPTRLREDMGSFLPDLVIAQIGGNDCQPIIGPDNDVRARRSDLEHWHREYGVVLMELVQSIRQGGAGIVLLDLQPARRDEYNQCVTGINEVTRQVASTFGIPLLSVYDLTDSDEQTFAEEIPVDGQLTDIRTDDGYHLNMFGGRYVARQLLRFLIDSDLVRTWEP